MTHCTILKEQRDATLILKSLMAASFALVFLVTQAGA